MNRLPSSRDPAGGGMTTTEVVEVIPNSGDWRFSCPTIKEKLFNSLLTGCFSDIRFTVGQGQQEIPAHRFILFLNSHVFETILDNNPTSVTISDVEPDAFLSFLKFLYTDEFDVHVKDATAVLYLSKKYDVVRLAALSAEHIKNNINTKNVVSVLLSSEALGESSVAYQARYFLRKNIRYVIHEDSFLQLNEDELCQIFASNEITVSELELFNAAVHWGIEECKRQNLDSSPQNYRFVLKNVLPLIRFPLMDRKEFTLHVATKGILKDFESLNIMMHWDVTDRERASLPPLLFNNKPRREMAMSPVEMFSNNNYQQYQPEQIMEKLYYDANQMKGSRGHHRGHAKPPPPPRRNQTLSPNKQQHRQQYQQPFTYLPDNHANVTFSQIEYPPY